MFLKTTYILAFFVTLQYLMLLLIKKESLGFGDVKIFMALVLPLSFTFTVIFFGFCGIFGLMFSFIYRKKEFPFLPSIVVAFGIIFPFYSYLYLI